MLAAGGHDKTDHLILLDCLQLLRLIQDSAGEHFPIASGNSDPNQLWPSVSNPRTTIMHYDLKVVWMIRMEASFKFGMSPPGHVVRFVSFVPFCSTAVPCTLPFSVCALLLLKNSRQFV
jgi:hypothetical protein